MRDITINDILKMILAHIKLIIIVSVIAALGAYIYADNFIPKRYSSTSMIFIKYSPSDSNENSQSSVGDNQVSSGSLTLSANIAENATVIFSRCEEILDITPAGYSVSISSINESNALAITVRGSDAQVCADTANSIRSTMPLSSDSIFTTLTAKRWQRSMRNTLSCRAKSRRLLHSASNLSTTKTLT